MNKKPSERITELLKLQSPQFTAEGRTVYAIIQYLDEQAESQETKASEDCRFCPTKNGVHIHPCIKDVECQRCGLPYDAHTQILDHGFKAKPQEEPKKCCEKCRQYLNKNMNRYECNRYFACPCHQKETEPKEECRFVRYCNQADHNCLSKIDGKYTILPRPKGWRIGQTIWNFKEWLRLTHEVKDFFYMTDDEWNRRWNEYLTSIKSQE